MDDSKFGFLSNHFSFHHFELSQSCEFYEQVKTFYPDTYFDYKYGVCFIEKETKTVLNIVCLTNDDNSDFSSFQHYLNQLPNLDLNNVAFLFALTSDNNSRLLNNVFQIPENYPSEFAQSFLKETSGQIIYTYQLMELLSFCLPQSENNHNQINEYRRLYNLRQADFYKKLEELYLPDGYNLYKLLKSYTPYYSTTNDFGFLRVPTHKLAYRFIEKAKKYAK